MAKKEKTARVRIKIAGYELEVEGPQKWADKTIKDFVKNVKAENKRKAERIK